MKAFFIQAADGKTRLERRDVPQPSAGPGQVLIRVRAAGLNRGEFIVGGLTKAGAAKPGAARRRAKLSDPASVSWAAAPGPSPNTR